jgi:hypothetical protein
MMSVRGVVTILNVGRREAAVVGALALAALMVGAGDAQGKSNATLAITAVSNRADLVSNGDVSVLLSSR